MISQAEEVSTPLYYVGRGISMHTTAETRHSPEFDHLGTHSGLAKLGSRFLWASGQKGKGKSGKLAFGCIPRNLWRVGWTDLAGFLNQW